MWHQTVEIFGHKKNGEDNKSKLVKYFNEGLNFYYDQEWDKAIKKFSESIKYETNIGEKDINPSKIYIKRSEEFKMYPPRKGWRGAFVLKDK